jgi:carnitine O-acetyltransferase
MDVFRQLISMDAVNHEILQRIEKAMFVVCLDDATPQSYDEQAFHIIGGDANNRWFDKVCQLIIFSNGKAGINGEHSPLDATVYVPLLEFVLIKYARQLGTNGYPDDLQTDPSLLPKPQKLQWKISPMISEMLQSAEAEYMKRWKNTDVKLLFCREAGTALLKKLKISPDSFVQIALQLAYYRMYGVPCATYETGQTRQFYHGRTETVRSCSVESVEFTKAMVSPEHNNESRLQLFKKAVESHKRYMIDAVSGKACDRHLFGLKLLALEEVQEGKLKQLPAIFTDPMYAKSTYYKLSTSNIPGTSTFCGGFGNVVKDGYGCCYITRPDVFIFGIVSDYSCDTTDSLKMKQAINDAVRDIIKLFPAPPSSKL